MNDPDGNRASPAEPDSGPVVKFQHPFFSAIGDSYFRISEHTRQPVLVVTYGELEAALSLAGVMSEFGIAADSDDGRMLDLVGRGVKFVGTLRVGDPIPNEVITGEASWNISDHHREVARQRITMQLITWMSGSERFVTDAEELLQIAEDPATKRKVDDAIGEAAERLGLGRNRREEVLGYVEELAGELAYVEALRELFQRVVSAQAKVQRLRRLYGNESGMFHVADPVARLIVRAVGSYRAVFEEIDAQTGEIMSVFKNLQAQREFIRGARDDLHCRLSAWMPLLEEWSERGLTKMDGDLNVMTRTYRFLAPRFMVTDEWVLSGSLQPVGNIAEASRGEDAGARKKLAHSMLW